MDHRDFDALTRAAATEGGTRRALLRLLAGGALAGVAERFGLAEDAAAKAKRHKGKKKRQPQAERRAQEPLQAEGKRKGKTRRKRPKPPPLPPGCRACTECQMCRDGACVPDPALDGVRCQGSGAKCGYCQGGVCAPSAAPPCPDGSCPRQGQCCPGYKRCVDPESPTGWACLGPDDCCPDQRRCAAGCRPKQACCPEERPQCGQCGEICVNGTWQCSGKVCDGGVCVPEGQCCPEEWQCADQSCVAQDECCSNERKCPDGACVSDGACCSGEKLCADGDCIPDDQCCPTEAPPVCGECDVAVCDRGSWVCQPQSGCCPGGYAVCPGVPQGYFWHQGRWLEGCCPADKMIAGPSCVQPWSGGSAWRCG